MECPITCKAVVYPTPVITLMVTHCTTENGQYLPFNVQVLLKETSDPAVDSVIHL